MHIYYKIQWNYELEIQLWKLEYLKKVRFVFTVQFQVAKSHTRTTLHNRPETKQTFTRQQPRHKRQANTLF